MQGVLQLAVTLSYHWLFCSKYATSASPFFFFFYLDFFSPCHSTVEAVMSLNHCCASLSFLCQSSHLGQRERYEGYSPAFSVAVH